MTNGLKNNLELLDLKSLELPSEQNFLANKVAASGKGGRKGGAL